MRIISGRYKRLNLDTLEGDSTRPTKDMVKEALFDSLWVSEGESFLDVFAGSGAVGIEAVSRCLEDAGTITSQFFPWNTCGATMRTFLGVNQWGTGGIWTICNPELV